MRNRRQFLSHAAHTIAGGTALLSLSPARLEAVQTAATDRLGQAPDTVARDEAFWSVVAQSFHLDGRYVILNGGGQNPTSRSVVEGLERYYPNAMAQPRPHNYRLIARKEEHRDRLARLLRCDTQEVALTRNTTEGLNIVAHGLDLRAGDEVLLSPFERTYAAVALRNRVERDGIVLREVELEVPPTDQGVVTAFRDAIGPRTRLIVVSHVADSWGFVLPIRELSALAHERGIQVLVDGALSFGHLKVDVSELGCDYFATSLHKWLGAPFGTGLLFVRKSRLADLWPLYGTPEPKVADPRKFERIGTRSGPTIAAIGQALDFYESIGPARKAARLRYLLQVLIDALADATGIRVITDRVPERRGSLARVVVTGWSGTEVEQALRKKGFWTYGGFDDAHSGVYVSPNLFNTPTELQRLAGLLRELARESPA